MLRSILFFALTGTALAAVVGRDTACTPGPITSNNRNCTIECGVDRPGGDYNSLYTKDFQTCINTCTADTNCVTAQYATSNSYCYLKRGVNPTTPKAGVNGVVCPDPAAICNAGPVVLNGRQAVLQCGVDHPGGDYSSQNTNSYQACQNLCAADLACASAQYVVSTKNCYLKYSITAAANNSNVDSIVFTQPMSCQPYAPAQQFISNGGFESGTSGVSFQTYQGTFQSSITTGIEFEGCHALAITPTSDPSGNRQYAVSFPYSGLKPYTQYTVSATVGRPAGGSTTSNAPYVALVAENRQVGGGYACGFANTGSCSITGTQGAKGQNFATSFYVLYPSSSLTLVFSWIGSNVGNEQILVDNVRLVPT